MLFILKQHYFIQLKFFVCIPANILQVWSSFQKRNRNILHLIAFLSKFKQLMKMEFTFKAFVAVALIFK